MNRLFEPLKMGALELSNRIVMAPLTRCRAVEDRIPNDLMREYYTQRASAGLVLTEATAVSPMGVGYPDTPGIWTAEQVAGWKKVTDAVRAAGGKIVLQLWHVGRISDPIYLDGQLPVAPSAIAAKGHVSLVRPMKDYVTPRALELSEISDVVEAFRQGAKNAQEAGFDGVEIHGANGYLPDQFLQSGSNHRTDEYGGSIENRARFLLEVTDAAIEVWGADLVGVHLSPRGDAHDMGDDNPAQTFGYVAQQLGERGIAFICARESVEGDVRYGPQLKQTFQSAGGGAYIANQGFTREEAERVLENGEADAVAWGQLFIANPDLPRRLELNAPLNTPDPSTFYGKGAHGYTDYPFLSDEQAETLSKERESVLV